MDDGVLVQRAREGDKEAFASIYDRYAVPLHGFLTSVVRDEHEAADLLHDTFLVAGARLHQLREPSRLRAWLFAIARHKAYRLVERRRRVESLEGIEVTASEPDVADAAVAGAGDLSQLVRDAAAGLSPRDQIILNLHLRGGLEGQELGDAIGVSADHAYVLLSRLRDQVERSLGALLVARQGRAECEALASVLAGWDGKFTTVWRKRVARHADECEICGDLRRRTLRPAALLGASPAFALPAGLRDRVLDDVQLVSHTGKPWPADRGGFPPPLVRRRRRWLVGVAAAAVLLLAAAGGLLATDDDDPPRVTSAAVIGSASPATSTTVTPDDGASETPTTTTADEPATSVTTAGPTTPATTRPPLISSTTVPPTAPSTTVARQPTTTAAPADTTPPSVSGVRVDPATVRAGRACANTIDPTQAMVTVLVTDRSGVAGVTLDIAGPAPRSLAMANVEGDRWTVLIGPFPAEAVAPGSRLVVPLTVRAVDRAGIAATAEARVTLRCDAIP